VAVPASDTTALTKQLSGPALTNRTVEPPPGKETKLAVVVAAASVVILVSERS
jgi:hypothetical protein